MINIPIVLMTVTLSARAPIREKDDFVIPKHEPSGSGYSIMVDTHDNLQTKVKLPKYERTLTPRFQVNTGDVKMDELNKDVLALIERYYTHGAYLRDIYYDPLWLATAMNISYKDYKKSYMDDDFFMNIILDKDRYFQDENWNRYTGFDWQELLFTFDTEDFRTTPMADSRFYNGFIKYVDPRTPLRGISPVIPQDFAVVFTDSPTHHRFDMTLVNKDFFELVGRWRHEALGDRWSYADSYNLMFGALNERAFKTPVEFQALQMSNHYKTSMNYILNYGNAKFTPHNEEIEYNYQYFSVLYAIIYEERYPKFRFQERLMNTIADICERDPYADATILTNWCEYIILEARYTGEW